ncbi:hypothetical protein CYMTET_43368 [Cymbomonas tetramitiformis]|uniref:Uncharacterized protein n=1 Tax=Cymbomonas tetramitiformis TaxID=36881 RepID=A0AAE0C2C6_9CHLO|nr:hypothetical protein CYMTET_43368 [Cymbomonas tetramitiformis]
MHDITHTENDGVSIFVHACCNKLHEVLHGIDVGVVCILDATTKSLQINSNILLRYADMSESAQKQFDMTLSDAPSHFMLHDDTPTLYATFDDHLRVNVPKGRYSRCMHNKAVQRLLVEGRFLQNLTLLFLYSKVSMTDRFSTGYKTLMMVAQTSTAKIAQPAYEVVSGSRAPTNNPQQVHRPTLASRLHATLQSLFYYWFDVHESTQSARKQREWTGCVNDRTVWACAWAEFSWLRDVHPTYRGQRVRALHAFLWQYAGNYDALQNRIDALITANQQIMHDYGVCDVNLEVFVDEDRASLYNDVRAPSQRVIALCATLMVQLLTLLLRDACIQKYLRPLLDGHECVLHGLHVWGDGFTRRMADAIDACISRSSALVPYICDIAWFESSAHVRYRGHESDLLSRYNYVATPEQIGRLREPIRALFVRCISLRNKPARYDLPLELWVRMACGTDNDRRSIETHVHTHHAHITYEACAAQTRRMYAVDYARCLTSAEYDSILDPWCNAHDTPAATRVRASLTNGTHCVFLLRHADQYRNLDVAHTARSTWRVWMPNATVLLAPLTDTHTAVAVDHASCGLFSVINAFLMIRRRKIVSVETLVQHLAKARTLSSNAATLMLADAMDAAWHLRNPVYAQFGIRLRDPAAINQIDIMLSWVLEEQNGSVTLIKEHERATLGALVRAIRSNDANKNLPFVNSAIVGLFLLVSARASKCAPRGWSRIDFNKHLADFVNSIDSRATRQSRYTECAKFLQTIPTRESQQWMLMRAPFITLMRISNSAARNRQHLAAFDVIKLFAGQQDRKARCPVTDPVGSASTATTSDTGMPCVPTATAMQAEHQQPLYLLEHPGRQFSSDKAKSWHPLCTPFLDLFDIAERWSVDDPSMWEHADLARV